MRREQKMSKIISSDDELKVMSPSEFRAIVRRGEYTGRTTDACFGFAQANLVVVPEDMSSPI